MTLRLPDLGTPRAKLVADVPECEAEDDEGTSCRFHGRIAPLKADCDGGCTWWTYRFRDDRLQGAELDRSVVDVDAVAVARLLADADRVADELQTRIGRPPDHSENSWTWAELETREQGTRLELAYKVWDDADLRVTWTVTGQLSHHPILQLRVVVDDELRIQWATPTAEFGAPLLELRGGPLARPYAAPLWLDLGPDPNEKCAIQHDAVTFELADGRVYLGQYNAYCGGQACRIVDPATGRASAPAACLFGTGLHHFVAPIGDGYYLLTSSIEGGGTLSVERYDPADGADTMLEIGLSAFGEIDTLIERGSVLFTTRCDLPNGCEARDYSQSEIAGWRWTPQAGLRPSDGSSSW